MRRGLLAALVVAFFLLHQDFWLWNDARLVAGLPAGLTYHVVYCVAASGLMLVLVRWQPAGSAGGAESREPTTRGTRQ